MNGNNDLENNSKKNPLEKFNEVKKAVTNGITKMNSKIMQVLASKGFENVAISGTILLTLGSGGWIIYDQNQQITDLKKQNSEISDERFSLIKSDIEKTERINYYRDKFGNLDNLIIKTINKPDIKREKVFEYPDSRVTTVAIVKKINPNGDLYLIGDRVALVENTNLNPNYSQDSDMPSKKINLPKSEFPVGEVAGYSFRVITADPSFFE